MAQSVNRGALRRSHYTRPTETPCFHGRKKRRVNFAKENPTLPSACKLYTAYLAGSGRVIRKKTEGTTMKKQHTYWEYLKRYLTKYDWGEEFEDERTALDNTSGQWLDAYGIEQTAERALAAWYEGSANGQPGRKWNGACKVSKRNYMGGGFYFLVVDIAPTVPVAPRLSLYCPVHPTEKLRQTW